MLCYTFYSNFGKGAYRLPHGKARGRDIFSRSIFFAAGILLCFFFAGEWQNHLSDIRIEPLLRALLLLVICALFYLSGLCISQKATQKKYFRRIFILYFALYLYLLISFTLLDGAMGRKQYQVTLSPREYYLRWYVNLIPFKSIYGVYIKGFAKGYVNAYYVFLNLLGNLAAFMPFALFLPLYQKAQKKWYIFSLTMLLFVCMIELLQFTFMVGSCDIDDLLLNAGGAMIAYFILRIPIFEKLKQKICFED